ncbi:DrmB family protein [Micromonospora echinospora]
MTSPQRDLRVGALRPNQLLHTYGVGALADLPNLSVLTLGLEHWDLGRSEMITEDRLLAAVRRKLGDQVRTLRLPPHLPETSDLADEWARVGVPVALFPTWLRCSSTHCNRLAPVDAGLFDLVSSYQPDRNRYVHNCRGSGGSRPTAVPARFVLACDNGHLDDFPWSYFVHRGADPGGGHSLKLSERGSTGEAVNVFVSCDECEQARPISDAIGLAAEQNLPACRGRHPHLGTYDDRCDAQARTLALGATNSWFAMQIPVFTIPRAVHAVDQLVAQFWGSLELLANLDPTVAKMILQTQACWSELEPYGVEAAWAAIQRRARSGPADDDHDDLLTPEWRAFTSDVGVELPDFTTRPAAVPDPHRDWLIRVVLVPRLRRVAALYGFTRIDAPEWDVVDTPDQRRAPLSGDAPDWVPCAETRGEGIFLRFDEARIVEWEHQPEVKQREQTLIRAHDRWRAQRRLPPGQWPGLRYLLLHTFAHVLIREFALECGYSAAGIGEQVYARSGEHPMAGVLLYTAAPDSEGTLGGLVSLGRPDRLGPLIERGLEAARLCSSDPLCAEHDPTEFGRLSAAACHACLFAAETSCHRGNHYLDRALLVDTLTDSGYGFFGG